MNIEGLGYFEVSVNGTVISTARNLFAEILIQAGVGFAVPIARITLDDQDGILSGPLALVDGALLKLKFGSDSSQYTEVDFNVYSKDTYTEGGANAEQILATLDVPGLIYESSFDKHKGSSVDAIAKVFSEVGFPHETEVTTSDEQLWINCGESRLDYLRRLNTHAYVDDKSCVYTVIDLDKAVTENLFEVITKEPELTFVYNIGHPSKDDFKNLVECTYQSRSGFLNSSSNYGQFHQQHSLTGEPIVYEKVEPTLLDGTSLPISTEVKGKLEASSHIMGSFYDSGNGDLPGSNVHENYYRAKYQNLRYYSLFSEGLVGLSRQYLNPKLLQPYIVDHGEVRNGEPTKDVIHSGVYLLVGKTIILRGMRYAEKYEFARYFLTNAGNTGTVSGSSEGAASSSDSSLDQALGGTADAPTTIVPEGTPVPETPEVPKTPSGNKLPTKVPNVLDKSNKALEQVNEKVKTNAESANSKLAKASEKVQSAFDKAVEDFNNTVDGLESDFKDEANSLGFDALEDKYGKGFDKADALLGEFQSAIAKVDACKMLNSLQAETLRAVLPRIPSLVDLVEDRLGRINGALEGMYNKVDDLIAKGEIDGESLDSNKFGVECDDKRKDLLDTAAAEDKVKQACLDDRDLNKINRPIIKLLMKENDLNKKLSDLLCSMGQ